MVTWVFYFCLGLGVGGAAGFYFARLDDLNKKKRQELENKLVAAEKEFLDYKKEVTGHFMDTATLINNMTDSYQAVHEHLTKGAQTLCSNELEVNRIQIVPVKTHLIETPTAAQTNAAKTGTATTASTPADNAPQTKHSPAQPTATSQTQASQTQASQTQAESQPRETPPKEDTKTEPQTHMDTAANKTPSTEPVVSRTEEKIKLERNEHKTIPQAAVITPPIVESMAVVDESDTLEPVKTEEVTAIGPDRIIH